MISSFSRYALVSLALAGLFLAAPTWAAKGKKKADNAQESQPPVADVVARVGDSAITFEELDARTRSTQLQVYQALYDARRAVLDTMIVEKLLADAAAGRAVTVDELVDQEITQKVAPLTDADIEKFYNENAARMGGRTLEQMTTQIRSFLETQRADEARKSYVDQLKRDASISVMLDPPRVTVRVADNDPAKGPAKAAVEIVAFSEFQ